MHSIQLSARDMFTFAKGNITSPQARSSSQTVPIPSAFSLKKQELGEQVYRKPDGILPDSLLVC